MEKRNLLVPPGLAAVVLSSLLASPAEAQEGRWRGPGGEPLPFATDEEVLLFLREAEVVDKKVIPQGINKPVKVRLRKDGVEANAIFRTVRFWIVFCEIPRNPSKSTMTTQTTHVRLFTAESASYTVPSVECAEAICLIPANCCERQ